MGRIVAPFGVRGWVRIRPQTESTDGLLGHRTWWLAARDDWQPHRLLEGRVQGTGLVARLEGIEERDRAGQLRGWRIALPRSALPPAAEGEYYWSDLIGLSVVNREGVPLGRVDEIFATGANDVLVVRGERERLIPFVAAVVVKVDIEASLLTLDWGADY
ncbi:MAG: ribosome maturation factor RimM [Burkholderiales bacterium]|nr:ribosome maturation factor RimM [Burkholderiales bacterium]